MGVAADVMQAAYFRIQGDDTGAAQFSMSASGTLVYILAGPLRQPHDRWCGSIERDDPNRWGSSHVHT